MVEGVALRPIQREDLPSVRDLLSQAGLPLAGVEGSFSGFLAVERGGRPVGTVGVETAETTGMVRSLAVEEGRRSRGIGDALLRRAEEALRAAGIAEAWVLTETAGAFFVSRGYRDEPRSSLPPTLTGRSVLAEVCPCSCRCLRKSLGPEKTSPS